MKDIYERLQTQEDSRQGHDGSRYVPWPFSLGVKKFQFLLSKLWHLPVKNLRAGRASCAASPGHPAAAVGKGHNHIHVFVPTDGDQQGRVTQW